MIVSTWCLRVHSLQYFYRLSTRKTKSDDQQGAGIMMFFEKIKGLMECVRVQNIYKPRL
jgi:hypothetical protein